ncbi:hypothetical protein CTAYLR_000386 [Chrysophaeum taylorii]|uniref:JmjC domain-containing protein n=1 Tax=Chrysophaeum taylorii TaxID=2483200 RepID=A0AAD7UHW9_9STRA|nr:hypothetical protein CTAYLR_000386 [Chrysophaeum taylorii]
MIAAEARRREAVEFYRREQWTAAACAFGEASEAARASPALFVSLSKNLAVAALRSGDARRAEAACSAVLEVEPDDLKSLYRRGLARIELRAWEGAHEDLSKASEAGDERARGAALAALQDLEAKQSLPPPKNNMPPAKKKPLQAPPKYETAAAPPPPKTNPTTMHRGFLLRARRRTSSKTPHQAAAVASKQVQTVGVEVGAEVVAAPRSPFTAARPSSRQVPEEEEEKDALAACAAALWAALREAAGHRDEATRRLDSGDAAGAVEACDRALAIADPVVRRCRAEPVRMDASTTILGSQVQARLGALATVGARACLIRGASSSSSGHQHIFCRALGFCRTGRRTSGGRWHRGFERIAREAYLARAVVLREQGDLEGAARDALRSLALDPWADDATALVARLVAEIKGFDAFALPRAPHPPGSIFRGSEEVAFAALRPGQKLAGARRAAWKSHVDSELEKRATTGDASDLWHYAPSRFVQSAPAGDVDKGGPIHLFLFRNDGAWTGGVHACFPRACGAATVGSYAAKFFKMTHDCACRYPLYLRDGSDASHLPVLPNFSWIAVGDNFGEVWDDTKVKGYVKPPAPRVVAATWRISGPGLPRRHAHWLVAGRLRAYAAGADAALDDLSRGRAVVLRGASFAGDDPSSATTNDDVRAYVAPLDAPTTYRFADDARWRETRESDAPRGVFAADHHALPAAADGTLWTTDLKQDDDDAARAVERALGDEFGRVASATARRAPAGALLPARFEPHDVVLAQRHGTSRFLVFDPLYHPALYAYPAHHALRRYSRLDLAEPRLLDFPLAAGLRGVEVELGPGDALALPRGWWRQEHCVDDVLVVEFAFRPKRPFRLAKVALFSDDPVLAAADLAATATALETTVARSVGKRNVAAFVDRLRTEVLDSGWQPWNDLDVQPLADDDDHAGDDPLVTRARFALGNLLGVDALEFFVSHYLATPRWRGLPLLDEAAAKKDDLRAAYERANHRAAAAAVSADAAALDANSTSPSHDHSADDDDDDDDDELPVIVDVTSS